MEVNLNRPVHFINNLYFI